MLAEKIKADLVGSMKSGKTERVSVLRMLISELNYKKIDLGRELEDADVVSVLQREAKKRNESIVAYTNGGRPEQAADEKRELEILNEYLPKMMSEEDVKAEIATLGLPDDFAAAMKIVSPHFRGRADGGMVAKLIKERQV